MGLSIGEFNKKYFVFDVSNSGFVQQEPLCHKDLTYNTKVFDFDRTYVNRISLMSLGTY